MLLAVWRGTEYCEYSAGRCLLCLHEAAGLVPDTHCHDPALHCAACALTLYSATLYTVHCTLYTVQVTMIHPCTCTLPSSVQTLTCVVMYIYLLFYIWIVLDFWIVSWRHSMAYSGFFRFIHCKAINIKFLYMSILPSWIARKVYTK